MITLPNKVVPYIVQDLLLVTLEAMFVDFEDKRLISLIDPTTVSHRVSLLRDSKVFPTLIEALDVFGVDDVLRLLAPKLELITNDLSLGADFTTAVEDHLTDLT